MCFIHYNIILATNIRNKFLKSNLNIIIIELIYIYYLKLLLAKKK
jgi:hypothetical protein